MLYLNGKNISDAAEPGPVMDAVEKAYALELAGDYDMPPRMHVYNGGNTILYMPCFLSSIFGTKILTLFPGNSAKGKPVIEGLVLLNDPETGEPLALLDGAKLTAVRTGAVGGVAVRHITPENSKTIGLIGAGVQGFHQLLFACTARNIERVYLYDKTRDKVSGLTGLLKKALPDVRITPVATVEELLESSEIVITATPATYPVLPDNRDQLKGKNFIGIGSYKPEMREFPEALFNLVSKVYIDTEHGLEESGDLITPLKNGWIKPGQITKLGEVIGSGEAPGIGETTLFKSVGMALFDLVVSEMIFHNALERKIGTVLD